MEVDYSPFLHVLKDGSIWWQLADAVKLGAGYLPLRDDHRNLTPVLRAQNHRVIANARTLLSEFGGTTIRTLTLGSWTATMVAT
jgi:hypothetical protein